MNQLNLGITIALRDAFSFRAKAIEHSFRSLDNTAFRAARGIQRSIGNIDLGFSNVARTLAGGAALLSTLIFPTRAATEFHKALSEVGTIADSTSFSLEKLRDTVLDQSLRLPTKSLVDQTQAVYEAVSAGFLSTADASYLAEEATKTAVTTMATTQTTLKGLVGLMNSYNMKASEGGRVSDLMFQTVRFGVVRMEELAHTIGMVSAAAAASGDDIENMMAMYATLTLGGLSPEQSAQYQRQLTLGIVSPTKSAMQQAKKYGIELSSELIRQKGSVADALLFMAHKTGALNEDGSLGRPEEFFKLLSGRQAKAGASVLLNKAAWFKEIQRGMLKDVAVDEFGIAMTNREFALAQRAKDFSYTLGVLRSQFGAFMAIMGRAMTEVLAPIARVVSAILDPIIRFAKAYPMVAKLVTGTIFAWGAALVWWGVIQMAAIRKSWAFLRIVAGFRRAHVTLMGMRVPLNMLAGTLAGTVTMWILGASLIHRAWKQNFGGLADKVRNFVLIFRALTQSFRSQVGVWGQMDGNLARQLLANGLNQRFLDWFQWLTRLKYGFKGLFEGIGHFVSQAENAVLSFGRAIGRGLSFFSGPLGRGVTSFFESIRRNGTTTNTIRQWREIGHRVGHLVGFFGSLYLLTKLWRSAVISVKVAAWMLTTPFKSVFNVVRMLVLAIAGIPAKLRALKGFFSGMWSQSGAWWANRRGQMFGGGTSGFNPGPSGGPASRMAGMAGGNGSIVRLLTQAVMYLRLIYALLRNPFGAGRRGMGGRPMGGPGGPFWTPAYGYPVPHPAGAVGAGGTHLLTRGSAVGPYVGRRATATARISSPLLLGAGAVAASGGGAGFGARAAGMARGMGRFVGRAALFVADFFTMGLASVAMGALSKFFRGAIALFMRFRGVSFTLSGALTLLRTGLVRVGVALMALVTGPALPWIAGITAAIGLLVLAWMKFKDKLMQVGWIKRLVAGLGWIKDKVVALLQATGLMGEGKFADLFDRKKQVDTAGAEYRAQALANMRAGGTISPHLATDWIRVYEKGLEDYLMEEQSGAFAGNPDAKKAYGGMAQGLINAQNFLREHGLKGFDATVSDQAIADVIKKFTGVSVKVQQLDGMGAGSAGLLGADSEFGEMNEHLADINDSTARSLSEFEAMRRGGRGQDWTGQKWPTDVTDPYAAFAARRMGLLAQQRNYGTGTSGDLGAASLGGGADEVQSALAKINGTLTDLLKKDTGLVPVEVKVNERTLATITLKTIDAKNQETRERGPNISVMPGVYPAFAQ